MKSINKAVIFSVLVITLTSCAAFVSPSSETPMPIPTQIPSATSVPTLQPTLTITPTLTPTPSCVDIEISTPMTGSQIEYLQNHTYNFLYSTDEKIIDNVYSLNRADTICSPRDPGNYNVWKVISGFIVDLEQPDTDLYFPGGEVTEGARFVNIYARARFISRDGKEHDYWLQLTGDPQGYWFQLAQWGKPISESKGQSGLAAMDILATEKNSDGTTSYIDASRMIPDGLVKVNDQFVAILLVGYTTNEGFIAKDVMKQFINAFEGKADYPAVPEGFFINVQAMIVPLKP